MADLFRPSQKMLFASFWSGYQDHAIIARRRLGKTRWALQVAILMMYYSTGLLTKFYPAFRSPQIDEHMRLILEKNSGRGITYRTSYFLPEQNQSSKLFMTAFKESIAHIYYCLPDLAKVKIEKTQTSASLTFGPHLASIHHKGIARGADNQRGSGNELAIIDEIQHHDAEALMEVVYPTLADNAGRRLLIGTANASAALKEVKEAYEDKPDRKLFIINADQSVKAGDFTQAELDAIISKDYGGNRKHPSYLKEWMCMLNLPISGAILEHWRPGKSEYEDGDKLVLACDIGYNDPYAVLLFAIKPNRRFTLVDGFKVRGKTTPEVITLTKRMLSRLSVPKPDLVILPHDANNTHTSSVKTDKQIWDEAGVAITYRMASKFSSKEKAISSMLNIIHLVDRSESLNEDVETDLHNWAYDLDSKIHPDRPKHDRHSHVGDAFQYGVTSIFSAINWLVPPEPREKEPEDPMKGILGPNGYASFRKNQREIDKTTRVILDPPEKIKKRA